jgi:hypothetical protein
VKGIRSARRPTLGSCDATEVRRERGDADHGRIGEVYNDYEPTDRSVTAEELPFPANAFDAAMATFTVHQRSDLRAGQRELRRVTSGPVAILTGDPARAHRSWLTDYASEVLDTEARRYPAMAELAGFNATHLRGLTGAGRRQLKHDDQWWPMSSNSS